jgi:hypothetical protein
MEQDNSNEIRKSLDIPERIKNDDSGNFYSEKLLLNDHGIPLDLKQHLKKLVDLLSMFG